ncbi:beta strand repeat-containing protein [Pseudoalteromonas sp. KJ10-2]|uniref:beta strand repeat-containing protein n=1 Tax=Psychromonas sp. KJ10-2 TaxID=3391822 RepID=UPI0039B52EBB
MVTTFETSDEDGDEVTVTLSDTVNYEIVGDTVVLTEAGAALVNSGEELPAFTLIPNDGTTDGEAVSVEPSVTTTNDAPEVTITSTNDFTEDDGSAVEGAVVVTFETSDEDGDDVTVTLSDTVNYEIVGDTVVLTEAGAALVNSGEELPTFTLIPNDGTTDGEAVSVGPSVTTTNDAPEVTVTSTNDFTEDDGSAVEGAVVATFETTDEDGDEVTVTLSDTVNYEIVGDTVVLTEAGAALVNSGEELPAFTLIPNDGTTDGDAVSVEPSVTTTNDAPEVTVTSTNDFTEDDGSAVEGAVVATFETTDEDGDDVTVTLSDTVNYEIVGDTVVLTEVGAALVNSGEELPAFTLIPNDGTTDGEAVSVEPSVTTTNDAPEVTVTSTNDFTEDDGSAVEGAVVATFETSDEDGDDVTVILSDTVNYEIVGDTVVLTEAGAALVNSGEELPALTLIPNDGTTDGEAVSVEPSVTTTNDAPEVTVTSTNDFTEDDGSAVEGAVVATFETTDEDGDDVTVTLSDTVNYEIVGDTVVLTEAGAALVNSGEELPTFTLIPNDGTTDGEAVSVEPSVTTTNDAPEVTVTSTNDFTEDDGSAVEGAVVATFETTDEDGDDVTVTLSDTVNYQIVGDTVVLTEAGAALVNSGEELPAFTLIPNDGTTDGEAVSVEPGVTTTNDAPEVTVTSTNDFTEDDGSAVEGAVVATFETSDEDGDDVTVILSDTVNYEIVGDTVVLTEAGAALVNSGEELPSFTLIPNDGTTDGETVSVEPSVTTTNDAPEVTVTSTNDFTEDDGSAVEGAVVATFETSDEDGDDVTLTLSDTVNYEIVGDTVVLTEAGAALVNSGEELPAFTLIPNDGTTDGETVSVEPSVTTTNDAPEVTITSTNDFTEDDGSAVEGAVVATFETSDEDGDDVIVTLSDTVNYEIVGDTVVLTEVGAALVNSGEELPTFTLIPNDGTTDGEAVSVEPGVTTTNDAPEVTVTSTNDFTEDDGSAVEGAVVATFETTDEDGDDVTVTLSDTVNYQIVGDTVVLTEAGAALVNSGEELPAFTLIPNDGTTDGEAVSVEPSVTTTNDAPEVTVTSTNDFTEDDGSAVEGAVVATFETTDEDGDDVTVTLSDTVNYEIVGDTVILTEVGAALVNSGEELPAFTLIPNDGTTDGEAVSVEPGVTTTNDAPEVTVTSINDFTEDDGSAVEGAVVATFETSDEDGDDVTVTLSDTVNYEIVGDTVVLTEAGAALVNSGEELPTFTLIPNDGTTDGEAVSVEPDVTGVDDQTNTNEDSVVTTEDIAVNIDVLANDTDEDGVVSPVASVTDGTNGTVAINANGTVTYTPDADFNGTDTFTYTNEDGNTETVTVTVEPVADDTVLVADSATTDEDTPVVIDVVANDTDADGVTSPVASVTDGTNGTVSINTDGTVTYTPNADFNGEDEFTYTNEDGNTETVTVTVDPVADDTVLVADSATTDEDTPVVIDVVANDTDADGEVSPVASVTDGTNGTVAINADGTVTYTPNADFNGEDEFTYTNADGNTETVTVTVDPVADDTVLVADSATTDEDTPVVIDVVANDTDADGEVSPVASVTDGTNGTVSINTDGTVTYTPNADFNGEDEFTYTNADGNTETVTVTVEPVADDTVLVADSATTDEDTPVVIDVVANDTDADGEVSPVASVTDGTNGTVAINADGTVTYTPNADFNGEDEFTYTNADGNTETVTVTVEPVADDTVLVADSATTDEDTPVVIDVVANDTDADGVTSPVASVTDGTNGTVAINADGTVTYTPNADFNGEDEFTYTNADGNTETVTVTVDPVADDTVLVADSATTDEDTPVVIDVVANDTDADGEVSPVASVTDGTNGTVAINADGTVTYTPNADFNGEDEFTYTNADGNTETVTVTVDPVADDTVLVADSATTDEDTPVVIDVVANDTDADGEVSPVASVTDGTNGTVAINADGTVTYTPNADFNGEDEFTYTNADGNTETVTVTVDPVADDTVLVADSATTDEDTPVVIDVVANDTDADGVTSPVASVTDGTNGTVAINADGTVTYTPNADFNGEDEFTYTNADGNTETVTVTVDPVADDTVLVADSATTDEDTPVVIDVVANDTDADGEVSPVASVTDGTNGTVAINADGTVTYTPNADFNGEDEFTYTNEDGNTETVTVTVEPVADDTVLVADSATTDEDTPVVIDVVANDTDADGEVLTCCVSDRWYERDSGN